MNDFMWAVKQMKEGKKVKRSGSFNNKYYMFKEDDWVFGYNDGIKSVDKNFELIDFEATDWEIYSPNIPLGYEKEEYYECVKCHKEVPPETMGYRCPYCNEWTYTSDCLKKRKKDNWNLADNVKIPSGTNIIIPKEWRGKCYSEDDIKTFIKKVKQKDYSKDRKGMRFEDGVYSVFEEIDKRAGDLK